MPLRSASCSKGKYKIAEIIVVFLQEGAEMGNKEDAETYDKCSMPIR
jgi:hypothetical protein